MELYDTKAITIRPSYLIFQHILHLLHELCEFVCHTEQITINSAILLAV